MPVVTKDALTGKYGEYDMVLANPPFGKKSSVTIISEGGVVEGIADHQPRFWATISSSTFYSTSSLF